MDSNGVITFTNSTDRDISILVDGITAATSTGAWSSSIKTGGTHYSTLNINPSPNEKVIHLVGT